MAYTHSKYEVNMVRTLVSGLNATTLNGVNLSTVTGVVAYWAPGYVPHLIRGAAVMPFATDADTNALSLGFQADISTPGTPTRLFTITVPTTRTGHTAVYYQPTYDIEVKPGSLVQLNVTAAATQGRFGLVTLYVEPRWDDPSNVTGMLKTT